MLQEHTTLKSNRVILYMAMHDIVADPSSSGHPLVMWWNTWQVLAHVTASQDVIEFWLKHFGCGQKDFLYLDYFLMMESDSDVILWNCYQSIYMVFNNLIYNFNNYRIKYN